MSTVRHRPDSYGSRYWPAVPAILLLITTRCGAQESTAVAAGGSASGAGAAAVRPMASYPRFSGNYGAVYERNTLNLPLAGETLNARRRQEANGTTGSDASSPPPAANPYPGRLVSFQPDLGAVAIPGGSAAAVSPGPPPAGFELQQFDSFVPGPSPLSRREARRAGAKWSASTELILLTDVIAPYGPTIVDDAFTGAPIVTAADLKGTYGLGTRVGLSRQILSPRTEVQIVYFGVFDWNRGQTAIGANNLELAGPVALATADFFDADYMTVNYQTNLHSTEVNLLQSALAPTRHWVFGFRWLNWSDNLNVQSTNLDFDTSDMNVDATNNLLGGQVGLNQIVDSGLGRTAFRLRGGAYANIASQTTVINDNGNLFVLRDTGASNTDFASVEELGITHSFMPMSGLELHFGYNLVWIQGLARAPAQVDLTDTVDSSTAIFMDGSTFLQGACAGLTLRW